MANSSNLYNFLNMQVQPLYCYVNKQDDTIEKIDIPIHSVISTNPYSQYRVEPQNPNFSPEVGGKYSEYRANALGINQTQNFDANAIKEANFAAESENKKAKNK